MNCQWKKILTFLLLLYCLWTNYLSKSNSINNGKKKGYLGKTCSSSNKEINELACLPISNKDTSLEIYAHALACLPISNKLMVDQSYTYIWVVCLSNIPFLFFEHFIFNLKLFDALCRWVFTLEVDLQNLW